MKEDRERSELENCLGLHFPFPGLGSRGSDFPRSPFVIFWHLCRLTPAEAPVRRVSGNENGGFLVFFDRERSERENFVGHNFSLSWGWGLEGRISRGPPCYFLALLSFDTCRSTCSPRFRRRQWGF